MPSQSNISDRVYQYRGWLVNLTVALLLILALRRDYAVAQDENSSPATKRPGVTIAFLPPPLDGTLSIGIYNLGGKLIRTLAREATERDFTAGLNGFITHWDGRDDVGNLTPAGSYSVRGYGVGAIEVEGIAYHGNDWMLDDQSPRIRRVLSLALRPSGRLVLWAEGADGKSQLVRCDQLGEFAGEIPSDPEVAALAVGEKPPANPEEPVARAVIEDDRIVILEKDGARVPVSLEQVRKPIDVSLGFDGVWVIDEAETGVEVKEIARSGEFRRRLAVEQGEPTPRRIFASRTSDLIFLIEEKPGVQRVRGLALQATAGESSAVSTWQTVLSKSIASSDRFEEVADKLGRADPFVARDRFVVRLQANPLLEGAITETEITAAIDEQGSFLKVLGGLPLRRITETPHLKWVVIGSEGSGRQLTIFQSDGAVVEEFRARKIASMMAFDAGDYEWKGK